MIREGRYSKSPYGKYRAKKIKEQKETERRRLYNDRFCPYRTILIMEGK